MDKTVLLNKQDEDLVNLGLTKNDLVWLNSRGGRTRQDVSMDKVWKFLNDEDESEWGRTYLPVNYKPCVQHTSCLKVSKKTGKLHPLTSDNEVDN